MTEAEKAKKWIEGKIVRRYPILTTSLVVYESLEPDIVDTAGGNPSRQTELTKDPYK